MRVVVQRVSEGSVEIINKNYFESIGKGLVILLGIKTDDSEKDLIFLADKCCNMRIFEDENGKMNKSVQDVNGEILIISQFTLYGDAVKGNRPSFTDAARPEIAIPLYEKFITKLQTNLGVNRIKTGLFGEMMNVKIFNDGPVTIILDSK